MKKKNQKHDWIDNFKKGDIFYDVGANIGVYSLYASKKNVRCTPLNLQVIIIQVY